MGAEIYNQQIDMWSVACIFAELILREPLFAGKNEMDQLDKIFAVLGNPSEENWPGYSQLKLASKVPFNKRHSSNKLRDKFPSRPCGASDSMYLTDSGVDLLKKLFCLDPTKRMSAKEALEHSWFQEEPAKVERSGMPNFPEMNKISRD